jgi:hypothetical protein
MPDRGVPASTLDALALTLRFIAAKASDVPG